MAKPELESSEFLPICLGCSDQKLPSALTSERNFPELRGKKEGLFISLSYLPMHEALTHLHLHLERVHKSAPDVLYLLLHREDADIIEQQPENVIYLFAEKEHEEPQLSEEIPAKTEEPSLATQLFSRSRYLTTVTIDNRPVRVSIGQGPLWTQPWLARKSPRSND